MNITFYGLPDCINCKHLKELFKRANTEYEEIVLTKNLSIEEFKKKYPTIEQFPFVIINEIPIGGLIETVKYFVEHKLVSGKK